MKVLLLLACLSGTAAWAEDPSLGFRRPDAPERALTLSELKRRLKTRRQEVADPFHGGKRKRYAAFALTEFLDLAYGPDWRSEAYTEAAFKALDGYESVVAIAKLKEPGPYLAYDDLDVPGWEPIGHKKADPAPFYLFWTGKAQNTEHAYPWVWQLAEVQLLRFSEQYPAVYPQGAAEDSAAYRGFRIFKDRCIRCHAIAQQGGKIGPDLGAPKNITEYRTDALIKDFIRKPSAYRFTQMPDHEDLSERNLDDILEYFHFTRRRKR